MVLGVSKQAVHKALNKELKEHELRANLELMIKQIRQDHPTMSLRSMFYMIRPKNLGRDKFEAWTKEMGYMVERRSWRVNTTDSSGVIRFDNLLVGLRITELNQVWSSDITYYQVGDRFYYLCFIIDCHSRRILGHSVSEDLSTAETSIPSLKMAIRVRRQVKEGVVFHSDGGGQYYCKEFLKLTGLHKMHNSMCEAAYENGQAERVNGTIKNNYLRYWSIESFADLKRSVDRAVRLYNHEKPHKSLKYLTPIEYEKQITLALQTKSKTTKSLDAKEQIRGALSPVLSVQTKSQIRNVLSAKGV